MTIDEFFVLLKKHTRRKRWREYHDHSIRYDSGKHSHCPLVFVCLKTEGILYHNTQAYAAAGRMKLSRRFAAKIISAADSKSTPHVELRERLLQATGLKKED